jgi:hypothetical protein
LVAPGLVMRDAYCVRVIADDVGIGMHGVGGALV